MQAECECENVRVVFSLHKRRATLWGTDLFLFAAQGRDGDLRRSAGLLCSLAESPVHYGSLAVRC
jgi:hypothetical protein